jgi:hypothetical protein
MRVGDAGWTAPPHPPRPTPSTHPCTTSNKTPRSAVDPRGDPFFVKVGAGCGTHHGCGKCSLRQPTRTMSVSPRPFQPGVPGSRFPISGVGAIDNATVWFRGLFSSLGCALAACGRSGKEITPLRANMDDYLDFGGCAGHALGSPHPSPTHAPWWPLLRPCHHACMPSCMHACMMAWSLMVSEGLSVSRWRHGPSWLVALVAVWPPGGCRAAHLLSRSSPSALPLIGMESSLSHARGWAA